MHPAPPRAPEPEARSAGSHAEAALAALLRGLSGLARNLPLAGATLGLVAIVLAIVGFQRGELRDPAVAVDPASSAPSSVLRELHHVGRVVTLNGDYPLDESRSPFTSWAFGLSVVAAGVLGLEIFRFLAGHAYDMLRRRLRWIIAQVALQRRVLVIGNGPAAEWLAARIAEVPRSRHRSALPAYQVSLLRERSDSADPSASDLGALMIESVPRIDRGAVLAVGAAQADDVVLLPDSDARGLEVLSALLDVPDRRTSGRRSRPRAIRLALASPEVVESVRRADLSAGGTPQRPGPEVRVWLPDEVAARRALARRPLDWRHPCRTPGGSTELFCIGFGESQRAFVLAALRQAHHVDESRLRVTIVDPVAPAALAEFLASAPAVADLATIEIHAMTGADPRVAALLEPRAADPSHNLAIAISVSDVDQNLELALGLPACVRIASDGRASPPVYLRQSMLRDCSLILRRLARPGDEGGLAVEPWGSLQDSFDPAEVLESALDGRARRMHAALLQSGHHDRPTDAYSVLLPWNRLQAGHRDDFRSAAELLHRRLHAFGMRIATAGEAAAHPELVPIAPRDIPDEQVEAMARMEHRRWVVVHRLGGWRPGPRDDRRKLHPDLVPWEALRDPSPRKQAVLRELADALFPDERLVRVAQAT